MKGLGVWIDESLSWHRHVSHIVSRSHSILRQLYQFKYLLPDNIKLDLINCLILPLFDYCDVVYQNLNGTEIHRLQKSYNSCIRFALNPPYRDHITPLLSSKGILTLNNRRQLHVLNLTFKTFKLQIPIYLRELFELFNTSARRTRNSNRVRCVQRTLEIQNRSFTCTATTLWNSLPPAMYNCPTVEMFCDLVRKRLLERQL